MRSYCALSQVGLAIGICLLLSATACGGPSGAPSPEQQRSQVVQFLRAYNQADNDFRDVFKSNSILRDLSGDFLQVTSATTSLTSQLDEFERRMAGISAPAEIPELGQLKSANQQAIARFRQVLVQIHSAIQTGNRPEAFRATTQLVQLDSDPVYSQPSVVQEQLLSKYAITDAEVSYRRLKR